jgi:hypothetical protein
MAAVQERREEKKADKLKAKARMKKEGVTIKGRLFGGTDSIKRQKKEKNLEKKIEMEKKKRKSMAGTAVHAAKSDGKVPGGKPKSSEVAANATTS